MQSGVGVRPEKPAGHFPSPVSSAGLILVVVDIFTGEDVGPLVGLCVTGDDVGTGVGLGDCGAFDGWCEGFCVTGALDGFSVGLAVIGADDGREVGAIVGALVGLGDTGECVGRPVGLDVTGLSEQATPQEQGQLSISSSTCCRVKPMSINKAQSKKPCPSHPKPIIDT